MSRFILLCSLCPISFFLFEPGNFVGVCNDIKRKVTVSEISSGQKYSENQLKIDKYQFWFFFRGIGEPLLVMGYTCIEITMSSV